MILLQQQCLVLSSRIELLFLITAAKLKKMTVTTIQKNDVKLTVLMVHDTFQMVTWGWEI